MELAGTRVREAAAASWLCKDIGLTFLYFCWPCLGPDNNRLNLWYGHRCDRQCRSKRYHYSDQCANEYFSKRSEQCLRKLYFSSFGHWGLCSFREGPRIWHSNAERSAFGRKPKSDYERSTQSGSSDPERQRIG